MSGVPGARLGPVPNQTNQTYFVFILALFRPHIECHHTYRARAPAPPLSSSKPAHISDPVTQPAPSLRQLLRSATQPSNRVDAGAPACWSTLPSARREERCPWEHDGGRGKERTWSAGPAGATQPAGCARRVRVGERCAASASISPPPARPRAPTSTGAGWGGLHAAGARRRPHHARRR